MLPGSGVAISLSLMILLISSVLQLCRLALSNLSLPSSALSSPFLVSESVRGRGASGPLIVVVPGWVVEGVGERVEERAAMAEM